MQTLRRFHANQEEAGGSISIYTKTFSSITRERRVSLTSLSRQNEHLYTGISARVNWANKNKDEVYRVKVSTLHWEAG